MTPRLFRIVLPVGDIDAAQRFYAEVLGSPGIRVSPGRHYFDCDGVILACVDPVVERDAAGPPTPNPEWMYFAVDDLEAQHAACTRAGASLDAAAVHDEPGGEIRTRPWGERSFYALDPFGNRICFVDRRTVFSGS